MKRVKTYILAVLFIVASSIMGACSCGGPNISVVDIKVTAVSDNLQYNETTKEYSVMQGEKFTVSYEILPANATDTTVYLNLTPANKIDFGDSIIKGAKNDVEFTASRSNRGKTTIEFSTKDGSKTVKITVNVLSAEDLTVLTTPSGLKYNETTKCFEWNKVVGADGVAEDISGYQVIVNDGNGDQKLNIIEKVDGEYPTQVRYDLESGVDYAVRVKSLGNMINGTHDSVESDSVKFFALPSVKNFKSTAGVLSWDYDYKDRITGYKIIFGNNQSVDGIILPNTTTFDMASYIVNKGLDLTSFGVQVVAVNENFRDGAINEDDGFKTYVLDSRINPQVSLSRLTAPTNLTYSVVAQVNSVKGSTYLSWDKVEGATGYDIKVVKYGTNTIVKNVVGNASTKVLLSDIEDSGKYTVEIFAKGDDSNTIYGESFSKVTSDFVVLPILNGTVSYADNSLTLDTSVLNSLVGVENISKLKFEAFTKSATGSYDNAQGKLVFNGGSTIDLTKFDNTSGYNILVRPVAGEYADGNVVVSDFSDQNKSYPSLIKQLSVVEILKLSNTGILSFTDVNAGVYATLKYKFTLNVGGTETERIVNNISSTDGGLITTDADDSTLKTVDLYSVFAGLIDGAGVYKVKILPISSTAVDASTITTTYFEFKKLSTVSGYTIGKNNTITWNTSADASGYTIQINDNTVVDANGSYTVTETLLESNTIRIQATGNNENTLNSEVAKFSDVRKAQNITGVKVKDGVLTWDGDIANSKYYVSITTHEGIEPIVATLTDNVFDGLSGIRFADSAKITIVRGIDSVFNSDPSEEVTISRLDKPVADSFSVVDNTYTIKFSAVADASSYVLTLKKDGVTKTIEITAPSISDGYVTYTLPELASGTYTVRIQARPADQTSGLNYKMVSELSENITLVVYPSVSDINTSNTLTWKFGESQFLKNFVIKFTGGQHSDVVTSEFKYEFTDILAGTYNLTIQALAEGGNVIYANPTPFTITKIEAPHLTIEDNRICFDAISNAESYELYLNGELVKGGYTLSASSNRIYIAVVIENNMEYAYSVKAVALENYLNSDSSNTIKLKMAQAPTNAVLNNSVLSWDSVANNNGYAVTFGGMTYKVSTESYTLPTLSEAGDYNITIVTLGGNMVGEVYLLNSVELKVDVTRLALASMLTINNNTLTWTYLGTTKPDKYVLYLEYLNEGTWTEVKLQEFAYSSDSNPTYDLHQITNYNGYKLKVMCLGSDANFTFNGGFVYFKGTVNGVDNVEVLERVSTPEFSYQEGILKVTTNENYGGYEFYIVDGETLTALAENKVTVNEDGTIAIAIDTAKNVTLKVMARGSSVSGKLDSNISSVIVVNKLEKITDFEIKDGNFTWSAVTNATGYKILNLTDTTKSTIVNGGATTSIAFATIFLDQGLAQNNNYNFAIIALGATVGGDPIVNYLNSDESTYVNVNCVDNVSQISVKNGIVTWSNVTGVRGYLVEIFETASANKVYSKTLSTTSLNLTDEALIAEGGKYYINVTPVSTESDNHIIINSETQAKSLNFERYNLIDKVEVEQGLLKVTLNAGNSTKLQAIQDIYTKYLKILNDIATGEGPTEVAFEDENDRKNFVNYYGYLNLRVYPAGYAYVDINPLKLENCVFQEAEYQVVYTFELPTVVPATTELSLKICAMGNEGNSSSDTTNYLPTLFKSLNVFKHSAPVTTNVGNLITYDGKISFARVMESGSVYVKYYVLNAVSNGNRLFAIIDSSVAGDSESTFEFNPFDLKKCYYDGKTHTSTAVGDLNTFKYYFYMANGNIGIWENNNGNLDSNSNYTFTLRTLGTQSASSTGALYLRSNVYKTAEITFLSDDSSFSYKYDPATTDGGYLSWNINSMSKGYKIYVISRNVIETKYPSQVDSLMASRDWVNFSEAITIDLDTETTDFMFFDEKTRDLSAGKYWCALSTLGDGKNFITSPKPSNTIEVYKLNNVGSTKLENGEFTWTPNSVDEGKVKGYKVVVYKYDSEGQKFEINLNTLVGTQNFELPEQMLINGTDYTFRGDNGERYGIGVVAIGGKTTVVSGESLTEELGVSSNIVDITKYDADMQEIGFARLANVICNVNVNLKQIEWKYSDDAVIDATYKANTNEYKVYVNGVQQVGSFNAYQFSNFALGGSYDVSIKAYASGSEYLNSLVGEPFKIVKYFEPSIVVTDGVINWGNDQNGLNLVPYKTTIVVEPCDKSGAVSGMPVYQNADLDGNINYYSFGENIASGYYKVTINYNEYNLVDEESGLSTYHLPSETSSIVVYKYATPVVLDVPIMEEGSDNKNRETGFSSASKWEVIKDGNGNNAQQYKVVVQLLVGETYEEKATLNLDLSETNPKVFVRNASTFTSYPDAFDQTYLFEYNADTNMIYFNTDYSVLANVVEKNSLEGETIVLDISVLGNTVTDTSVEYDAKANSSVAKKVINFSVQAPFDNGSDVTNGIVRWRGTDNPVRITYKVNNGTEQRVWLGSDYIEKYGKVYYLPNATNANYGDVNIQYILSNNFFSNICTITFGNVNLFESGVGTEEDPYVVSTSQQFANIKYRPNSVITVDSSLSEISLGRWTMIDSFAGVLNGNGAIINNINLIQSTSGSTIIAGLINRLEKDAVIKNFTFVYNTAIENSNQSAFNNNINLAGVALYNYGTISGIKLGGNTTSVTSMSAYSSRQVLFGGLSLYNYGKVENVEVLSSFKVLLKSATAGSLYSGGVVFANYGIMNNIAVDGVYNLGGGSNERVYRRYAGGVVYSNYAVVLNSDFTGRIDAWTMGGIAVYNNYIANAETREALTTSVTMTINNSLVTEEYVGGNILGCYSNGTLNLTTIGTTSEGVKIGGIASFNIGGKIVRCYAKLYGSYALSGYGDNSQYNYIGGIVGLVNSDTIVDGYMYASAENCYSEVSVTVSSTNTSNIKTGAIVGAFASATGISENYNIAGNIYYVTSSSWITKAASDLSDDTVGAIKLSTVASVENYVNTLDGGLNSNTELKLARIFVYANNTLKLEMQ